MSSHFGVRHDPFSKKLAFHPGVDIAVPAGTLLRAAQSGRIVFSGRQRGHGNTVVIEHDNGLTSQYSHNAKNLKKVGDRVAKGDAIAKAGSTGRSTGPHVHFEVRQEGRALNPLALINVQA